MKGITETQTITRRRLLRGGATLAVGAAGLSIVGCGDDDDTSTAPSTASTGGPTPTAAPSVEKPTKGGTLRVGQTTDMILTTGWPLVNNAQNRYPGYAITETLLRYRDGLTPENVLVDRFEYNADRTKATLTLKPDLAFHNGAKVTPDDVFFGIDLMLDPKKFGATGSFQLAPFAKFITDRKKIDERTMEFSFDRARPNMTDFFAQMQVTHAASYEDLKTGKSVQGTGPFKFAAWEPGKGFRFDANRSWHGSAKEGGPYVDAIEGFTFADQESMATAFEAGALDLVLGATGTVAKRFRDKKQTAVAPKVGLIYVGCVVTNSMLKDRRVRQAIFVATDRARLAREVSEGFTPVTAQAWPQKSPAFDPNLQSALYDPAKAKDLLQQAGFVQDRPLKLAYSATLYGSHAAVVKENLEAVGIKIELVPTEANAFLADFNARKLTDLFISASAFSDLTPLTMLQQAFPFRIPNLSYFAEPGSDSGQDYAALIKELEVLDPASAKAKEAYARFNKIWLDEAWLNPLLGSDRIELIGSSVRGADEYFITIQQQMNMAKIWKKA